MAEASWLDLDDEPLADADVLAHAACTGQVGAAPTAANRCARPECAAVARSSIRYRRRTCHRHADGWEIDAGQCHGIEDGDIRVAVHGSRPVREALVTAVHTERSEVRPISWTPDRDTRYPVVLSNVPIPPTTVLVADEGGAAAAHVRTVCASRLISVRCGPCTRAPCPQMRPSIFTSSSSTMSSSSTSLRSARNRSIPAALGPPGGYRYMPLTAVTAAVPRERLMCRSGSRRRAFALHSGR